MLFSCSEEEVVKITDEKDFIELNNGVECINGDLYFTSSEDFYRIIDFIISSTDDEIKSWENSLDFVSFRTLRDSLEDDLQKDRRRVFVETYLQYIYGGIYIPGESWIEAGKMMISIKVYGEKKNFWGNWKRYKTDLVFKSGSFDVYIPEAELGGDLLQESPIWSVENWNASSSSDMKEFSQHKWIYKYPNMIYPAEELLPSDLSGFYFEKSYVKATSRGVGYDNYAIINCGS